jgi:hypothetical protein
MQSQRLRCARRGIQDVVSAAFQNVKGIRIGFAVVLAQIEFHLLRNTRNAGDGCRLRHPRPAKGIVRALQQRRLQRNTQKAGYVV